MCSKILQHTVSVTTKIVYILKFFAPYGKCDIQRLCSILHFFAPYDMCDLQNCVYTQKYLHHTVSVTTKIVYILKNFAPYDMCDLQNCV